MRFEKIGTFKIEELQLDEGNYRFKKAENQKECIRKIYETNTPYFKGLMKSIAEDDLGEPLLVYKEGNFNIVVDGNRRLSALKVLYSDEYAPSSSIAEFAHQLKKANNINFDSIQAQVSADKKLVSKTIYERHSSGKNGTSRIPWNAYAAARFGYDEKIGEDKEWRIMALLSKTEEKNPSIAFFLDSSNFSYEVYRRITRTAIRNKIISENIFSDLKKRIKQNARKDLIKDAVNKSMRFLKAMEEKELTLSRSSGNYADQKTIENFLKSFTLSPDNAELEAAKENEKNGKAADSSSNDKDGKNDNSETKSQQSENNSASDKEGSDGSESSSNSNNDSTDNNGPTSSYGITKSEVISKKLGQLKHKKLAGLYNSLCRVSLEKHPTLMYSGAWSFMEVLSRTINPDSSSDFVSFFSQKMGSLGFKKSQTTDFKKSMRDISDYGNAAKHSPVLTKIHGPQLRNHFDVLEPLLIKLIDLAIKNEKERS